MAGLVAIAAALLLAAALLTKDPARARVLRLAAGGLLLAMGVGIATLGLFLIATSLGR